MSPSRDPSLYLIHLESSDISQTPPLARSRYDTVYCQQIIVLTQYPSLFLILTINRKSLRVILMSLGCIPLRMSLAPGLRPWRQWWQWRQRRLWWRQAYLKVSIFCFLEALSESRFKKMSGLPRCHFLDDTPARPRHPNYLRASHQE